MADKKVAKKVKHWKKQSSAKIQRVAKELKKEGVACDGVIEALKGVSEGKRDNTLVGLIYFMRIKEFSKEDALDVLRVWAKDCEGVMTDEYLKYKVEYHCMPTRRKSVPCTYLKKAGFCKGCTGRSHLRKLKKGEEICPTS